MLVCHCCVVHEGRIREEIARGARDEVEIGRSCGAGTGCGGCVPLIRKLLGECVDCPLNGDTVDLSRGNWDDVEPRALR